MHIPPIAVRENADENINLFILYLYHKNQQQKQRIINLYPELVDIVIKDEEQAKPLIVDFVQTYFQKHKDVIDPIVAGIKGDLQVNGHHALEMLASIMEHEWTEAHHGFTFVPSLLPFSPWDEETNTVYLSLVPYISGDIDKAREEKTTFLDPLQLLVHEVSHLILWDIVSHLNITLSKEYSSTIKHLAQEIIAPVVMNQPGLQSWLGLNDYWGNHYLNPIALHTDKGDIHLVTFFFTEYTNLRAEGKTFEQYILRVFEILTSLQIELQKRMDIWDKNGKRIFEEKSLWEEYVKPIDLINTKDTQKER